MTGRFSMQRLRIRTRLVAGFGAVLAALLLLGAVGTLAIQRMGQRVELVGEQIFQRADALSALQRSLAQRDATLSTLAAQEDIVMVRQQVQAFQRLHEQSEQLTRRFDASVADDPRLRALAADLHAQTEAAQPVLELVLRHAAAGNRVDALRVVADGMGPVRQAVNEALDALQLQLAERAAAVVQEA